MKPSEILSKIRKKEWTTNQYWNMDDAGLKFCFNGYIINEILGYPEPQNGDNDLYAVYGVGARLIHDIIADINDSKRDNFTTKKNLAIAFLKRENL